jgi:pyruvate/2-oxoglutarate dehydrogenase complex dihydrolipoamide acyltransferase (E2) component
MVDRTEFFQKLVSAVRIRRGMDSTSLVNHIAFSAGAPKNGQMMAGAGAVLEILIRAGALVEQGGVLVVAEPEPKEVSKPELPSAAKVQTWSLAGSRVMSNAAELFGPTRQTKAVPSSDHKVTLQIQVKIACTAEDIETLGPRLRKLLTEIDLPIDSKTSVRIEAQDQEDLSGA